jgi:VWFA-related protein
MCKRVVVLVLFLLLILFSAYAQTNLPPQAAVRSEPIVLTVTVMDEKGRPVNGLKTSDFIITEGKVAQPIVSFDRVDQPLSVGIVFDASDSMSLGSRSAIQRKRNILISALDRFLEGGNDANEYFVQTFGSQTSLILDWTSERPTIIIALASVRKEGQTALYDGCFSAIQKLADASHSKRVLFLITDGEDNNSHHKVGEVRELLKESNILFYSMIIETQGGFGVAGGYLDQLTWLSGGKAFFPRFASPVKGNEIGSPIKADEIDDVLQTIAQELRAQYTMSIAPAPSIGKKKWHKLKIKISQPANDSGKTRELWVRAREGYYQY